MKPAYYNESDRFAAAWLRQLIVAGAIAPGEVDERDIRDVRPSDLRGFRQCHFFAGIGTWSYALRGAGWADAHPVWTASCPCQPFSQAGGRAGFADQRHLWPAFFHLFRQSGADVLFGEQVASPDGLAWLDLVSADLEGEGYAIGAADLCAAGFGAPHIRQRLYFVAHAQDAEVRSRFRQVSAGAGPASSYGPGDGRTDGLVAHAESQRCREAGSRQVRSAQRIGFGSELSPMVYPESVRRPQGEPSPAGQQGRIVSSCASGPSGMEHATGGGRGHGNRITRFKPQGSPSWQAQYGSRAVNGFWSQSSWVWCRDGRFRPVEPGSFPLVAGTPARVGRLRGYGNALCAEVARHFIEAYLETMTEAR